MPKELLTTTDKELEQGLARSKYSFYAEYVHEGRWILGKHLELICNKIEELIYRRIKENILIISMPPQHGKSQAVTETLPSWYLGKWPHKRVIEVSYGDDLARRFGRRNKQKITQFGKELFNIELAANSRSDTEFEIADHSGSMISRGIMAGITGQPGDLIIIDDPIKNKQEAESETYRERIWEEFLNSILTRLSADGVIILIMTRWHEDDLAGRILANMPDKALEINIPLEAEENDILGRELGEPLFPEIGKDKKWLEDFKQNYQTQEGTRAWLALMQGRPTAAEGNLIKRKWWKYYTELPPIRFKIITIDATFKKLEDNDFVVIQAWGKHLTDFYLIDQIRARMTFTETIQAVIRFNGKHKDRMAVYIEDKANGSAIIDVLSKKTSGIIAYQPKDSKEVRAQAVMPLIEAGNVYLPQYEAFTNDFVNECAAFPNGTHDDQVDAMSMGLQVLKQYIDIPQGTPVNNQNAFTFQDKERNDLDIW